MPTENTERTEQATAELLRERLAGVLPVDRIIVESLPEILDRLRRELLPVSGRPLCEILLDPTTNIGALNTIKDYGKRLATQGGPTSERDTAVAIYFAAIASALVFHGQKISTYSYEALEVSFAKLTVEPWMSPELASLFGRARSSCKTR